MENESEKRDTAALETDATSSEQPTLQGEQVDKIGNVKKRTESYICED